MLYNITVSVPISSITSTVGSNTLYPTFSSTITDYCVRTTTSVGSQLNNWNIHVNGNQYTNNQVAQIHANDLVCLTDNLSSSYYIRFLPQSVMPLTVTYPATENYISGYYLTAHGNNGGDGTYYFIYDKNAVPIWYATDDTGAAFSLHQGCDTNWLALNSNNYSVKGVAQIQNDIINYTGHYVHNDTNNNPVYYGWDVHEVQQIKTPSRFGNVITECYTNDGFYLQEQTPSGDVVWDFYSDSCFNNDGYDGDTFHLNSVDVHPTTGDVLCSFRHTSTLVCIEYATKNILWVIQGQQPYYGTRLQDIGNNQNGQLNNTVWFENRYNNIQDEPYYNGYQYSGTCAQHDARWQPNLEPIYNASNFMISCYDDESGAAPNARCVIYEVDPIGGTLYHRSSIFSDQGSNGVQSPYQGGYSIVPEQDGTVTHVADWIAGSPEIVEYRGYLNSNDVNSPAEVLSFNTSNDQTSNVNYRFIKTPLSQFDVSYLRNTAGHPVNTTIDLTPSTLSLYALSGITTGGLYFNSSGSVNIPTNGLIYYFDVSNSSSYSGSGALINDLSINANNAALNGNWSYNNNGNFGNNGEIILDGSNAYISTTPDLGQYYSSTSESIFVWVYPQQAGQIISEHGYYNSGWTDSQIEIEEDGTINFCTWYNDGSYSQKVSSTPRAFNQWYLVGFTYDGTTLTAYINGEIVGTTNINRNAPYNNSAGLSYYIGYPSVTNMGTTSYLQGKVRSFYAYNRSLTQTEVSELYNASSNVFAGAIAYYDLNDSNWTDITGNGNNLTPVGSPTLVQGILGNGAQLTSGSDYLQFPAGLFDVGSGAMSVSVWVYLNQTDVGYQWIICQNYGQDAYNWVPVYIEGNSGLSYILLDNNSSWSDQDSNVSPTANQWHHIVTVVNNGTACQYLDGVLLSNTSTYAAPIQATNSTFTLGAYTGNGSGQGLTNIFDEVGIWNRALSQADVTRLYNSGKALPYKTNKPIPHNLVLWLDSTNPSSYTNGSLSWNDLSNVGNNASLSIPSPTYNNKFLSFDGSSNYVSTIDGAGLTTFTISLWVNTTESGTSDLYWQQPSLIGKGSAGVDTGDFGITTNNGYIGMWGGINTTGYDDYYYLSTTTKINDGKWHNIVVSNDGSNAVLYVDGRPEGGSFATGGALDNTENFWIGGMHGDQYTPSGFYHSGLINDVLFYTSGLNADEILTNYNNFKSKYYNTSSTIGKLLFSGNTLSGTIVSPLQTGLQAYWKMDEISGTRYDSVSNQQMTETNGSVGSTLGINDKSADISNGNNSWLTLPAGVCDVGSNQKSFSIWFKLNETNIGYQFIGPMQGTGHDYDELNVLYIEGNSTLNMLFNTDSENHWAINLGNNIIPTANEWHHYVATFGNGICTAYYDGNQIAQFSYSGAILSSNGQYTLGHYDAFPDGINGQAGIFYGQIDEFEIWNRVLSPSEVTSLYNSGNALSHPFNLTSDLKAYWKFDGNGTDSSGNGNDLTDSGGTSYVNGIVNQAASFQDNGVYLYNNNNYDLSGDFTLSCWVNFNDTNYNYFFFCGQNPGSMYFGYNENGLQISRYVTDDASFGYPSLNVGTWYHMVLVRQGGNATCYINGQQQGSTQNYPYDLSGKMFFGYEPNYGNGLNGLMDEAGIWSRALSQDEITQLYNNGRGLTYPFFGKVYPKLIIRSTIPVSTYQNGLYGWMYYDNGNSDASFSAGPMSNDPTFFAANTNFKTQNYVATELFNFYVDNSGTIQNLDNYGNFNYNQGYGPTLNNYSWEFLGYFKAPYTDNFTFFTYSDDASYLWIGNNAVSGFTTSNCNVNNGGSHGTQGSFSSPVSLVGGQYYPIRIQYGQGAGGAILTVGYSSNSETNVTNWQGIAYHRTNQDFAP
jgi:hypothetical protein